MSIYKVCLLLIVVFVYRTNAQPNWATIDVWSQGDNMRCTGLFGNTACTSEENCKTTCLADDLCIGISFDGTSGNTFQYCSDYGPSGSFTTWLRQVFDSTGSALKFQAERVPDSANGYCVTGNRIGGARNSHDVRMCATACQGESTCRFFTIDSNSDPRCMLFSLCDSINSNSQEQYQRFMNVQYVNELSVAPTTSPTTPPPTTAAPSTSPSASPTKQPSKSPTKSPTKEPTNAPSKSPTPPAPSTSPTKAPTGSPSKSPSKSPSSSPTKAPTTPIPSKSPTTPIPTSSPTPQPSKSPTGTPTRSPSTSPTFQPTGSPTLKPTKSPTPKPTPEPTPLEISPFNSSGEMAVGGAITLGGILLSLGSVYAVLKCVTRPVDSGSGSSTYRRTVERGRRRRR